MYPTRSVETDGSSGVRVCRLGRCARRVQHAQSSATVAFYLIARTLLARLACRRALSAGVEEAAAPRTQWCTVDLTRGYDQLMLAQQPLPASGGAGAEARLVSRAARYRTDLHRVDASLSYSCAQSPLVVPCFLGGALGLASGLQVRAVDAAFDGVPSESDEVRLPALSRVRLVLLDGHGKRVGDAVWCNVHELLVQLQPTLCVAAEAGTEHALRDRKSETR